MASCWWGLHNLLLANRAPVELQEIAPYLAWPPLISALIPGEAALDWWESVGHGLLEHAYLISGCTHVIPASFHRGSASSFELLMKATYQPASYLNKAYRHTHKHKPLSLSPLVDESDSNTISLRSLPLKTFITFLLPLKSDCVGLTWFIGLYWSLRSVKVLENFERPLLDPRNPTAVVGKAQSHQAAPLRAAFPSTLPGGTPTFPETCGAFGTFGAIAAQSSQRKLLPVSASHACQLQTRVLESDISLRRSLTGNLQAIHQKS